MTFRDGEGRKVGQVQKQETLTTWMHLFLVFALPFSSGEEILGELAKSNGSSGAEEPDLTGRPRRRRPRGTTVSLRAVPRSDGTGFDHPHPSGRSRECEPLSARRHFGPQRQRRNLVIPTVLLAVRNRLSAPQVIEALAVVRGFRQSAPHRCGWYGTPRTAAVHRSRGNAGCRAGSETADRQSAR